MKTLKHRHHLWSQARYPKWIHAPWNDLQITDDEHHALHYLFGLQNPVEIVRLLLSGEFQLNAFDDRAMKSWTILFDHKGNCEAAEEVFGWIPWNAPQEALEGL